MDIITSFPTVLRGNNRNKYAHDGVQELGQVRRRRAKRKEIEEDKKERKGE